MKKVLTLVIALVMAMMMFTVSVFAGPNDEPLGLAFNEWETGVSILDGTLAPDYRQCTSTIRDSSAGFDATMYVDDEYDTTPYRTNHPEVKDHVLKLCGELLYSHADTDFGKHFVTRADVRKGNMVDNSFAGMVVNYSAADGVGDPNRMRTAYAWENDAQGYAFQSGYGFTFLADSDDTIRFYARCLAEDLWLDVIYFDYNVGYDVTKAYTEVYIYTDMDNGQVLFFVNDRYAGKLLIDIHSMKDFDDDPVADYFGGVGYDINDGETQHDYENTFGGTYYTVAEIFGADGVSCGSTDNARINTGEDAGTPYGTLEIVSTCAGTELYVDQLDAMDYATLPEINEENPVITTLGSVWADVEGARVVLNISAQTPQTMMNNNYGASGYLNWSDPREFIEREALTTYMRANPAEYSVKLVANDGSVYETEYVDGAFTTDAFDLDFADTTFTIELYRGETLVDSVDDFSIKSYLETVDDQLAKDVLALASALDYYNDGEGFEVEGASAKLESLPERTTVNKGVKYAGDDDYVRAATLCIDEDLNIIFKTVVTNADKVEVAAVGYATVEASGEDTLTKVYSADISLANLGATFTAKMFSGDDLLASAEYSALDYIYKYYNSDDEAIAKVCQALYAIYADLT